MTRHVPRRRCVGCGRVAPKSELLRIAAARERADAPLKATLDPRAVMTGRGAYLCLDDAPGRPVAECLARALRTGGIARGLRRAVVLDSLAGGPELVESVSP